MSSSISLTATITTTTTTITTATTTTTAPTFEGTEEEEESAAAAVTATITTRLAQQMLVGGDSYIELSLQPSTADKKQVMVTNNSNNLPVEQQTDSNKPHKPQQKCSISSSSSMLTNSNSSSSMTSIATSSPTSTSFSNLQHSMRSVSMSLNSSESSSSMMPNAVILANENTSNSATTLEAKFDEVREISAKAALEVEMEEENVEFEVKIKIKRQPNDEVDQLLGDRSTSIIQSCERSGTQNENKNVVETEVLSNEQQQQQQQQGNASSSSSIKVSEEMEEGEEEEAPCCSVGEETVYVESQLEVVEVDENVARRLVESTAAVESGTATAARLERSNSCSHAETHSGALLQQTDFIPACLSQENLSNSSIANLNTEVVQDKINIVNLSGQLSQPICIHNEPVQIDVKDTTFESEAPLKLSSSLERQTTILTNITKVEQKLQQQQQPKQKQQSSSSRFFSSKLNTGSLWSLLSVGSSQSAADEQQAAEVTLSNKDSGSREEIANKPVASFFSRVQFKRSVGEQQMPSITYMQTSSNHSYEQANKPLEIMTTQDSQPIQNSSLSSSSSASSPSSSHLEQKRRLRFNVKYIGSAILHKNFTLPMLEWIAKDVKRQTIKGAQSISQRQFTIPARDILLDIQSYQLTAISCKDGHCIFVHPMHCISKYVQLQFDQTCFSYLIRDTKDSPNFCHVFQAKSANKIHDIFTTIREVTTRSNYLQQVSSMGQSQSDQLFAASSQNCVRKSASSDGQHTKLKGFISNVTLNIGQATSSLNSSNHDRKTSTRQLSLSIPSTPSISGQQQQPSSSSSLIYQKQQSSSNNSPSSTMVIPNFNASPNIIAAAAAVAAATTTTKTTTATTTTTTPKSTPSNADQSNKQFENSYQFEVMFVKKVKLQCRRVPASFVDDALETLKSFEVLKSGESKSSQIKGIGKRIINASVDERQEYDEAAYQSPKEQTSSQFKLPFERESQSCNQSPSKQRTSSPSSSSLKGKSFISENNNDPDDDIDASEQLKGDNKRQTASTESKKHHQSMDSLKNIDCTIKSAKTGNAPNYTNDFSPYNTITSIDLNERIAAIPVVSSSVSLDHETRQKLARQVRETIMATAANIKKDVYASGDKLDSSASSKALDSLSCTVSSQLELPNSFDGRTTIGPIYLGESSKQEQQVETDDEVKKNLQSVKTNSSNNIEFRRSSANCCLTPISSHSHSQYNQFATAATTTTTTTTTSANNFDLFRRASTRQVVKNRTMLLLIGKDELCTISIDKHQMLFSKSFNSIVHCLQGINNKDHFGLICRDSGKINPNTESYAGFIFKCQSEKVVREIMGALKQVIYSSQHNYHGQNSPYNPLNLANQISKHSSQRNDLSTKSTSLIDPPHQQHHQHHHQNRDNLIPANTTMSTNSNQIVSLAAKRGFLNSLEFKNDTNNNSLLSQQEIGNSTVTNSTNSILNQHSASASITQQQQQQQNVNPMLSQITTPAISLTTNQQPKNLIKSMFCDNCPLYWFHRLCCDIESLPSEASKAIILRRINSSMTDKEQDELYSRFSEFNIESIDEHNEIFMSLLRHLCERKQLKHSQSQSHISSLAKASALIKQQANFGQQQQQQQVSATIPATATSVTTTMVASRIATNEPLTISRQSHTMDPHQKTTTSTGTVTKSASTNPSKIGTNIDLTTATTTSPTVATTEATKSFEQNKQNSHHRSGSTSGSLAFVIGQTGANQASQSIADAGSVAFDNLKKAKNSISVSIENILKRRSSIRDDNTATEDGNLQIISGGILPTRAGSFKTTTRENRSSGRNCDLEVDPNNGTRNNSKNLKRSQSTSDYSNNNDNNNNNNNNNNQPAVISWRDSLSRTINEADLGNNPLVGLFKRRSSTFGSKTALSGLDQDGNLNENVDVNVESSHGSPGNSNRLPGSPNATSGEQRFMYLTNQNTGGGSSPSSMLSSAFWKKSIFDKIRQPLLAGDDNEAAVVAEIIEASKREEEVAREKLNKLKLDDQARQLQEQQQQQQQQETVKQGNNNHSSKRTSEELRLLWRKAIVEQITLLKMDKQNQRLQANTVECDIQRIKLNYRDVIYGREVLSLWDKLLKQDPRQKVEFVEVARLVRLGVPKQRRGEVWMFLMNQYQLRHGTSFQPADSDYHGDANQPYRSLLSQLSTQQHEIFVDIGRTFPSHPYYSQYLSIGQLSLFNLLKAYSLLDQEVGYCQGLSFVAGILLLHVDSEDEAFELMRHLLFNFGLRKQYLPSMNALHLQLYQITRLLRDHEYELFNHFDHYDISPSLYAAPWFLTLFASQFPLGFVARMLDLIFLIGIEAIFRVSLNLLAHHRNSILDCTSLESTMHFMKNDLVNISDKNLVLIFDKSLSLDLRNKLIEYEIEYTFYCAEDRARSGQVGSGQPPAQKPSLLKPGNTLSSEEKDYEENKQSNRPEENVESTSKVADATATIIIQHLLANNHLRSLRSNYSY